MIVCYLCLHEQQFENNQHHPLGRGESLMGREPDPMYRKTLFLTELRARNGLEDKTAATSDLLTLRGGIFARIIILYHPRGDYCVYIPIQIVISL